MSWPGGGGAGGGGKEVVVAGHPNPAFDEEPIHVQSEHAALHAVSSAYANDMQS